MAAVSNQFFAFLAHLHVGLVVSLRDAVLNYSAPAGVRLLLAGKCESKNVRKV